MPNQDHFYADLDRINAKLKELGAVIDDGKGFVYIDQTKVPGALLRTYRGLVQYGYANGLI